MPDVNRLTAMLALASVLAACGAKEDAAPALTPEERLAMAPSVDNGQRLFLECAVCHERVEGAPHRVGPNLWGIVGAPSAHHEDFTYSAAMKRAELTWTPDNLDAYIANPGALVPGNRMAYAGMKEPADRRDLIAYLETLH